jgi:hypothetical protein
MKNHARDRAFLSGWSYRTVVAILVGLLCSAVSIQAQTPGQPTGAAIRTRNLIVPTKFGGEILGYDIDQNGTQGLLSESLTLGVGKYQVATETFDQLTGQITSVVAQEKTQGDDFVTQGIFANHVGLELFQHSGQNRFLTLNPLSLNQFTGRWTPPLKSGYLLWEISVNQQTPNVAALQVTFDGSPVSFVFSSNIAANTFGPLISLQSISQDFQFPLLAFDSTTRQAVLAQAGICANCTPKIALVNLATGQIDEFSGLGVGSAVGLAVDSSTGTACTTTTIDQNVEFYDLAAQTGFLVHLPGASSELQSGQDVELDPINHLFLVQQYSSTGNVNDPQPHIYVYDEAGNLVETVTGLERIPISPVRIAINPSQRIGFVSNELGTALQSFTY